MIWKNNFCYTWWKSFSGYRIFFVVRYHVLMVTFCILLYSVSKLKNSLSKIPYSNQKFKPSLPFIHHWDSNRRQKMVMHKNLIGSTSYFEQKPVSGDVREIWCYHAKCVSHRLCQIDLYGLMPSWNNWIIKLCVITAEGYDVGLIHTDHWMFFAVVFFCLIF